MLDDYSYSVPIAKKFYLQIWRIINRFFFLNWFPPASFIRIFLARLFGAKIGKNCLLGSKTLIPEKKEIPDNSMVVGIPGKVIRTIDKDMEDFLIASADHYCENWKNYKQNLKLL